MHAVMTENTTDTSQTLNIFNGVPHSSTVLELVVREEALSADPEYVFVHPSDTVEARAAHVQDTLERLP